jgi:predicted CXXCH cytochrome family protein
MRRARLIKIMLVAGFMAIGLVLAGSSGRSAVDASDKNKAPAPASYNPEDYVGSETCKACHEEQFASFAKTIHSHLADAGWKNKTTGCESCHGPGKAHVDGGGDKTKIRTFEKETPKQISETCLACHAGKEEHNNYRRGEHWRNDIGCTDCHSPHVSARAMKEIKGDGSSSIQPIGPFRANANTIDAPRMLKADQPQLCMKCHNETKSQFTRPFHHRVLEGSMKCSDCHNPHGGFEAKQARLATGADAACFKCHSDKQGPFVFEHAPLKVEGCASCHDPHGSANPKLLKRNNVSQLCLECHSNIGTQTGDSPGTPGTPTFHNLTQARYQNCTICHTKIHGSNASRVFFR